jgi:hypothetical protein
LKGRVQDTNGILEKKEKITRRRRKKRNTVRETGMEVKKWKDKSKRKMDECRAEYKKKGRGN